MIMKSRFALGCILLAAIFVACNNSEKTASEQEYVKDWETEGVALGLPPCIYETMTPEQLEQRRQSLILVEYFEPYIEDSVITMDNYPKDGNLYRISISEDEAEALGVSRENYQQALKEIEDLKQWLKDAFEKGEIKSFENIKYSKQNSMIGNREKLLEMERYLTQGIPPKE